MSKNINPVSSLYANAWLRDNKRNTYYRHDALLIAMLAHTHGTDREGTDAQTVRELLDDINLEED